MYSSGYSQVLKSSPQAQKKMAYRSKGKSCGYYMRIVFFFSSLIQSLIIVSLVLFLVYGKTQDSGATSRIHDLEESFSRLSIENVALKQQRKNLTNLLNATLTEKSRNDWDLNQLRSLSNISVSIIQEGETKLQACLQRTQSPERMSSQRTLTPSFPDKCNCELMTQTLKTKLTLVESNFTETARRMKDQLDQTAKERDEIDLDVIRLRREKDTHEKEVEYFRQKCKEDFSQSLSGISDVSKAFLQKIDSLFPSHIAFQLTCPKQREHLEQIRTNCSSLSTEVEERLQRYLDVVGTKMSGIQGENSRLKAENWRLSEDYRWCSNNRTGLILQNRQNLDKLQRKHDEDKQKLLVDKVTLYGELEVEKNAVKYQSKKNDELTEQIKNLNVFCATKPGFVFQGGSAQSGFGGSNSGLASPSGGGQLGRSGSGGLSSGVDSFGPALNQPASTGTGSSSSSSASTSLGSSSGSAINKQGAGRSPGSVLNKPASTGGSFSNFGSAGSDPQISDGTGSNKPALSGKGSSPYGSSSASSGIGSNPLTSSHGLSSGKSGPTNSGHPWFGFRNNNSGQSKAASATGRGTSTGNSGGTGSSTGGLGGVTVEQHLRDLHRIINPSGPQDKQELSRLLG